MDWIGWERGVGVLPQMERRRRRRRTHRSNGGSAALTAHQAKKNGNNKNKSHSRVFLLLLLVALASLCMVVCLCTWMYGWMVCERDKIAAARCCTSLHLPPSTSIHPPALLWQQQKQPPKQRNLARCESSLMQFTAKLLHQKHQHYHVPLPGEVQGH